MNVRGPFHHVIFTQTAARLFDGVVHVPAFWNGNLRAYGALVPGTKVVLPEDDGQPDAFFEPIDSTLEPIILPGFETNRVVGRALAYARARGIIRRIVSESSFIQLQHVSAIGFLAGAAAVSLGKPFYVDTGGSLSAPKGEGEQRTTISGLARRYYAYVERQLARHARLLIAVSPHLFETFPPSDAPRVVVTHSMIHEKDILHREDACEQTPYSLFIATRLIESKGIDDLLRAVKTLHDDGVPVELKVAGVGAHAMALQQLAHELELDPFVRFLGGIPVGDALWAHYRSADVSVLPSRGHYEGTPRMIIESWAAGAPVVATTIGGIPAMVTDGEDGLLVSPGSVGGLVTAIKRVITNGEQRRRIVAGGYARVKDMTYEGRLTRLREAFDEHLPGLLPERTE